MLFLLVTFLMLSESYQVSMHDDTNVVNPIPTTTKPMRKRKVLPFALLHHLHVIPVHHVHTVHTEVSISGHQQNTTIQTHSHLIPLLIPVHSVPVHSVPMHSVPVHSVPVHTVQVHTVPVHDLSVIPVAQTKSYNDDDPYRNPIGGYGVGWGFGGHGAGHGFHYSYG